MAIVHLEYVVHQKHQLFIMIHVKKYQFLSTFSLMLHVQMIDHFLSPLSKHSHHKHFESLIIKGNSFLYTFHESPD